MDLPRFKYHPEPSSVFQRARRKCPCCGVARELEYVGPQYGLDEIDHLCGYCIADGSAARKFDLEFTNPDGAHAGPAEDKRDELIHRTPGYNGPEGDPWPAHCDDFCAHLGRVTWSAIEPLLPEVESDVRAFMDDTRMDRDELISEIERDRSPLLAHLFRCVVCGRHRFVASYE